MSQLESWLCSICIQVIQPEGDGISFHSGSPHDQTLERFCKAAAENCFICSKIWNLSGQHQTAWDSLVPEAWKPFSYLVDREEYDGKLHMVKLSVIFEDPTREQSEQSTDVRFRLIPLTGMRCPFPFAYLAKAFDCGY